MMVDICSYVDLFFVYVEVVEFFLKKVLND